MAASYPGTKPWPKAGCKPAPTTPVHVAMPPGARRTRLVGALSAAGVAPVVSAVRDAPAVSEDAARTRARRPARGMLAGGDRPRRPLRPPGAALERAHHGRHHELPAGRDAAQRRDGTWVIIETNDAQESGHCGVSPVALWRAIIEAERGEGR